MGALAWNLSAVYHVNEGSGLGSFRNDIIKMSMSYE